MSRNRLLSYAVDAALLVATYAAVNAALRYFFPFGAP